MDAPEPPEWHYEPSAQLDMGLAERLRQFPREPEMLVYTVRSAAALAMRAALKIYHRLHVEGREHLPREGSFVIVANHASHLDAPCLLAALPLRKLHRAFPAAAADYFFVNLPRTALSSVFLNALPFHRDAHARQSIAICRELLKNPGNVLLLFPEGTRSVAGELGPFKPGIGAVVAGSKIPVLPCFLRGAHRAWPKGAFLPRPFGLRLLIGEPCMYENAPDTRAAAQEVADDLREAVRKLGEHTWDSI